MLPNGPKINFQHPISLDLSVVIPVHRKRPGLERAIRSVLAQMTDGMELVIADHTHSAEIHREWCGENPRPRFEHPDPTGSMAGDWNRAISLCRGRSIHLLHDDDYVLQGFYQAILAMRQGFCYTGYRNEQGGKVNFQSKPGPGSIASGNFLQPVAVVVGRHVYEEVGGYLLDKAIHHVTDWEFYVRAIMHPYTICQHESVLAVHTEDGESESSAAGGCGSVQVLWSIAAVIEYMSAYIPAVRAAALNYYADAVKLAMEADNAEAVQVARRLYQLSQVVGS